MGYFHLYMSIQRHVHRMQIRPAGFQRTLQHFSRAQEERVGYYFQLNFFLKPALPSSRERRAPLEAMPLAWQIPLLHLPGWSLQKFPAGCWLRSPARWMTTGPWEHPSSHTPCPQLPKDGHLKSLLSSGASRHALCSPCGRMEFSKPRWSILYPKLKRNLIRSWWRARSYCCTAS